ncbi:MAG TPA: PKD domain-containing protein [Mycobacteriales bacterium]|nr:PKD domain-containing protein [Mycobacteriales bacterium]
MASAVVGLQATASAAAPAHLASPVVTKAIKAKPATTVKATVKTTSPTSIALGADIGPASGATEEKQITAFEATTGHQLAYTRDYLLWNSPFPTSYEQWLGARGTMPLISVKPQNLNGSTVSWASIAAAEPGSAIYAQMKSWADEVKAFGYPVYFTFNHEPEAAASDKFGIDTDYIAAWQNFHNVFTAEGVTNARWMWIMTSFAFIVPKTDPRYAWNWYPGDAYVDAIGADAYTAYTCDNTAGVWHPLSYQISGFLQFGAQHPTKPMWLPEFGVVEDAKTPGRKAQWITDSEALFKTAPYQQFAGIAWFNETRPGTACDWHVSTSASSQAAYNTLSQDPYYQGSAQFALPGPPAASFTSTCSALTCGFDSSGTTGAAPLTYSWSFGDGATSTAANPSYSYPAAGNYPVTLSVTDPNDATSTTTQNVTVVTPGPPVAAFISSCTTLTCSFNSSATTGVTPMTYSWSFGDGASSSSPSPSHGYAGTGTYPVMLTVTDANNATSSATQNVSVTAPSIGFVGSASAAANTTLETVHVPAGVAAGNGMILIATSGTAVAPSAPSGWTSVGTVSSPTMYGAVWQRVAVAKDAGSAVAVNFGAVRKGTVELLAYSGTSAAGPVAAATGATKETSTSTLTTPAFTPSAPGQLLLSYWAGRTSSVTTLTPPAGVVTRSTATGTGGGLVLSVAADGGTSGGLSAAVSPAVTHSLTWSILLAPGQ